MGAKIGKGFSMLITLIAFFFILGFAINIHELGHFLACRIVGIGVLKFSFGFGPTLLKKKIGTTDFAISLLPFGGFVKMEGEETGEGGFYAAEAWKRIVIVFLGPFFNIVSAFVVLFAVLVVVGLMVTPHRVLKVEPGLGAAQAGLETGDVLIAINGTPVQDWEAALDLFDRLDRTEALVRVERAGSEQTVSLRVVTDSLGISPLIPPVLGSVMRGGPAFRAGLKRGDRLTSVGGQPVESWEAIVDIVRHAPRETLVVVYLRAGVPNQTRVIPLAVYDEAEKETLGQINVMMSTARRRVSVLKAFTLSVERGYDWVILTAQIFYKIIKGEYSRRNIGGPIAIARIAGQSARWGFESLLMLLAIISINLGMINLVPLPAFDGGVILMTIIEKVIRRPFKKNERQVIQQVGFGIIILLVLFTLYNDLTR